MLSGFGLCARHCRCTLTALHTREVKLTVLEIYALGDPSTLPFFEKNLSSFSSAFDGHFLPHLLDVPDAVDPRSSLHLQQPCPHSPRGLSSRSIASLELQTALSPGEGEKAFHHRNRSRARRNHINCKCSAINAKAKMDDNTNANMIYSNLQSKDSLLNRDPIHE